MFKKLKAELKAVFKCNKNATSKSNKADLQPLQEQQQQQSLSQSYDGGLGRPWGLGGRNSLDVAHHKSEDKDAGAVLPNHLLGDNAMHHEPPGPDRPPNQGVDEQVAPWCRQPADCQPQQQQLHGQSTQHLCQAGTTPDTSQSPQSPRSRQAGPAAAADAVPDAAAAGDTSSQAASNSCAGAVGKSSSRSGSGNRKHTSHAAAGASASRATGPEPNRTPRDEDLGSCPPYATKAVWGLRYSMEDKWAAVPNLIQVPMLITAHQSKPAQVDSTAGCGCIIKTSKVLAKVSPSCRGDKVMEQVPLVTSHHGSEEQQGQGDLAGSAALQELDSLHYFGVFDGHGGADAARHCAQRMHQVLADTIRSMMSPEVNVVVAAAAAAGEVVSCGSDAALVPQQQLPQPLGEVADSVAAKAAPVSAISTAGGNGAAATSLTAAQTTPEADVAPTHVADADTIKTRGSNDWTLATLAGSNGNWLSAALSKAFVNLDREFGVLSEGSYVGSTAVVVVLGSTRLWVAHAGDSRAVLGRRGSAVVLTSDHKASRDDEVARVQAAGGHVWWDRVMGELAVSRAIGDHCLRPYVIPEPEVSIVERCKDDEVLVMASDGLWDVINNQEAAEMALHTLHAAEAAGHVGVAAAKRAATSLTKAALDRGTRDNVTVLVVDLRARGGSNHSSSHHSNNVTVAADGGQEKSAASSGISSEMKPGGEGGTGLEADVSHPPLESAAEELSQGQRLQQQRQHGEDDSSNSTAPAAVADGAQSAQV